MEFEQEPVRKISRREYEQMVELGMFEDEHLELLRGMLVIMTPQDPAHSALSAWLHNRLVRTLDDGYCVRSHSPHAASDDSEPEPDVLVTKEPRSLIEHPLRPELVIEVANSSIRKDRRVKADIYAEANVPEYWILDISDDELRVMVHTEPTPHGYRRVEILRDGDTLRPTRLPAVVIPVTEIPWNR